MTLNVGSRLGPYEILSAVGAGDPITLVQNWAAGRKN
jgi:hypothetical protein